MILQLTDISGSVLTKLGLAVDCCVLKKPNLSKQWSKAASHTHYSTSLLEERKQKSSHLHYFLLSEYKTRTSTGKYASLASFGNLQKTQHFMTEDIITVQSKSKGHNWSSLPLSDQHNTIEGCRKKGIHSWH